LVVQVETPIDNIRRTSISLQLNSGVEFWSSSADQKLVIYSILFWRANRCAAGNGLNYLQTVTDKPCTLWQAKFAG
jgi:hypothetical protein